MSAGYLFLDATLSTGARTPEVPRNQATAQLSYRSLAGIQARWSSMQFDDDLNQFPLRHYFVVDLFAARPITSQLDVTVSAEDDEGRIWHRVYLIRRGERAGAPSLAEVIIIRHGLEDREAGQREIRDLLDAHDGYIIDAEPRHRAAYAEKGVRLSRERARRSRRRRRSRPTVKEDRGKPERGATPEGPDVPIGVTGFTRRLRRILIGKPSRKPRY